MSASPTFLDTARHIVGANVIRFPTARPSMFRAEYGAITWITVHGPVRLTQAMAEDLRGILLDGGVMGAYFDLDEALLELGGPTVRDMLAASVAELTLGGEPPMPGAA